MLNYLRIRATVIIISCCVYNIYTYARIPHRLADHPQDERFTPHRHSHSRTVRPLENYYYYLYLRYVLLVPSKVNNDMQATTLLTRGWLSIAWDHTSVFRFSGHDGVFLNCIMGNISTHLASAGQCNAYLLDVSPSWKCETRAFGGVAVLFYFRSVHASGFQHACCRA